MIEHIGPGKTGDAVTIVPNPFNPSTRIAVNGELFTGDKEVKIIIYDIHGNFVQKLDARGSRFTASSIPWNASDRPAGIYILNLTVGAMAFSKKLVLVR
ncbi:MAG: hypothetical protein A2268_06370 [Candidatus Raymondbacteria bacterium RifOxyA12_full_50_37]|uniref:Secretion system C-terminal sorting domain-containing protein n=1 Tax=Candidatus Raymondbacteria bacterium RIFOXYD12_FULL_49_13 TaxID=1817890 RepID=A0A1F7FF90_UNCRA|nr:MAG: hypothetical protein A2350_21690 [Candidatus Raymondbacteria bacterium RifOxyB12_full_50_8]OGJ92152.1 MAG: hypothetical protein A2268_06370 [Candidatus Raymondbacteria bacterium RifOxyA12_full_50_37]OGJ94436.1 MAG: hypothetical protein A2248_15300 [Candidatus Raymondbacteria bacterium RIFOXYA2_FULL_49_16]OGJ99192.1 MAG: hypothetical protein A2453_07150 [Candidatus Raymondbacteria bacterium RIFOXYC2_FULL_50_21]OGK05116.1 MAG: hypothetical protein A2519_13390 [Candidatus Raymondbacteria b